MVRLNAELMDETRTFGYRLSSNVVKNATMLSAVAMNAQPSSRSRTIHPTDANTQTPTTGRNGGTSPAWCVDRALGYVQPRNAVTTTNVTGACLLYTSDAADE